MPRQRSRSHRAEGHFIVSRTSDLFICDSLNGPIQKGTTDGYNPRTVVRSPRFRPSELLVNCHGNIITLDTQRGNAGHLRFKLSATVLTRCLEELEEIDIRMLSTVVSWSLGLLVSWSLGVLVSWSLGALVSWCLGVLVSWSLGVLVFWCLGLLVSWSLGLLVSWSPCCLGALVSWCLGVLVSWSLGALVSWSLGALVSGLLVSWSLGALVSWSLGLLVSWSLGALVSWSLRYALPVEAIFIILDTNQREAELQIT